ncbi:Por secretion system C-terminal sorting domain-containing protein [Flexibacter flexilis DSM 6793]|uniref:Por secretion system C-terminal sorting domain-containing protein n=2 Tax=Flexibacter flexilis TaxID=998 RepID=A0A1I1L4B6_9BACT|nr:Por secretion system C-terminal sorting domain-containing protein [Flexibacter flexilis DSM 6793]
MVLAILLLTNYQSFAQTPDSLSFSANPFSDSTAARIFLGQPTDTVKLKIYNVLGTLIQNFEYHNWAAGTHEVYIGQPAVVGLYKVRLYANNDTIQRKIIKIDSSVTTSISKNVISITGNVWPNPAAQAIYLPQQAQYFSITDLGGKEILKGAATNNKSVSVANFPQGKYFIQLYDSAKKIIGTRLFIKE